MTSQKSYSDTRIPGIFSIKYLKFSLMRSWPHLVFYTIIFLFTIPVPLMFGLNNVADSAYDIHTGVYESISVALVFVSAFVALFSGMSTMTYVNSKTSVNFYHSLPLRREGHFLIAVIVKYVNYLLSVILNILIGAIAAWVFTGKVSSYFSIIFGEFFGYSVLFFSLLYFITLLASMIAGTGSMRFVTTLWILAVPFFVYSGIIQTIGYSSATFYEGYYFMYDNIMHLSPVIRMTMLYAYPMRVVEVMLYVAAALIIAVIACVLYVKRKSERSGDTVVYKAAGSVIKYVSMLILTLYTGIFFGAIGNSDKWMIFGFICGAVLSFMLLNTILYKNSRLMFKGIGGFAICTACFAVFFTVVGYDIFDIDSKFPQFSTISEITLTTEDELTFKNAEDIKFIIKQLNEYQIASEKFVLSDTTLPDGVYDTNLINTINEANNSWTYVRAYIKLPFGITIARSYGIKPDIALDLYKFIVESDELDEYFKNKEPKLVQYISIDTRFVNSNGGTDSWSYGGRYSTDGYTFYGSGFIEASMYSDLIDSVMNPFKNGVSQESFNKYSMGSMYIDGNRIPIFSDNTDFFTELSKIMSLQDYYYGIKIDADGAKEQAKEITELFILDKETLEIKRYTDVIQIEDIVRSMTAANVSSYDTVCAYTIYDPRYLIIYTTDSVDGDAEADSKKYGYEAYYRCSVFRDGMVPDFVTK